MAVRAGKLLAARLYGGAKEQMDYAQVLSSGSGSGSSSSSSRNYYCFYY